MVALNRFVADRDDEIAVVADHCAGLGVPSAASDHFARGGEGAVALAEVMREQATRRDTPFRPPYPLDASFPHKLLAIASRFLSGGFVVQQTAMGR